MHDRRALLARASLFLLAACGGGTGEGPDRPTELDTSTAHAEDTLAGPPAFDLPVLEGLATLQPIDEGALDTGFARFRGELLRAVARRDTSFLLSVVAPDIRNTFGDDNGREAFRRMWTLDRPDSEVWNVLERVLGGGGRFRSVSGDTLFMAPYVYAAWPGEFDAFQHVATIADDAVARARPQTSAAALGVLPYRIVRIGWPRSRDDVGEEWTEIELADGRRAWVASADVYSPVGYRAIFQRRDGRWLMTVLIAGD